MSSHGIMASETNKKIILVRQIPIEALKFFQLRGTVSINKPNKGIYVINDSVWVLCYI